MTTQDAEAVVDDLLTLPFPPVEQVSGDRRSGPRFHVHVLRASQDFWDDADEETVEAAEEEIDAALRGLVETLTARWGAPEPIDLTPYLHSALDEQPLVDPLGLREAREQDPVPEPIGRLCMLSSTMLLWRRPDAGRWVSLTVGQQDREFPIELLAAVGDAPIPSHEVGGPSS
ncbi:hypothetical protein [Nocardiopsis aegyptia]|uniref:Uncharacterized protein n=1 Tax=Nocardiopsis aegyptia TaxID=220378 RepID=A0A7Z0EI64_9ACTN|nr:hypothetical protein [Nocardiopsis aegyptia]NYJ32540.1 hypothetical protein [Nocardiopsis aegyptia]